MLIKKVSLLFVIFAVLLANIFCCCFTKQAQSEIIDFVAASDNSQTKSESCCSTEDKTQFPSKTNCKHSFCAEETVNFKEVNLHNILSLKLQSKVLVSNISETKIDLYDLVYDSQVSSVQNLLGDAPIYLQFLNLRL